LASIGGVVVLPVALAWVLAAVGHAATLSPPTVYRGMSDASGAIALGTNLFAVADNELSRIMVYRRDQGGQPLKVVDLARFLETDPRHPQVDVEAVALRGDRAYWISSHGRDARGRDAPGRERFFATTIRGTGEAVQLAPVGRPYKRLRADLLDAPSLARFHLATAALKAPKEPGGLNLEGLCAAPEGALWIGFRNPVFQGSALVVPLLNPDEVIEGRSARLGVPMLLDLDGLGIRDMVFADDAYVIIAGPSGGKGRFRLYTWSGPGKRPRQVKGLNFGDLHPEAVVIYPDKRLSEFQLLSDDGSEWIGDRTAKMLPPSQRQFRAVWVLPRPGAAP
jgi:hypothetical protein